MLFLSIASSRLEVWRTRMTFEKYDITENKAKEEGKSKTQKLKKKTIKKH
jgi:hypothetical protein